MKPGAPHEDPAFTLMTMDVLRNVLSRADHPGQLGEYLTEEVRELCGARCVVFIQCLSSATEVEHRIVSVNPPRRRDWADSPAAHRLYDILYRLPAAHVWRRDEPSEAATLLQADGFDLSLAIPLEAGKHRVGAMLLLGLLDESHLDATLALFNALAPIVALVLGNAFLYEKQDQAIREGTRELQAANDGLRENDRQIRALLAESERTKNALVGLLEDQQHAEAALRASERSLQESQRIAGLGSYVFELSTGSWTSSDVLDCLFGIGEAYERSTAGWAALLHPDDRAVMMDYFQHEVLGRGQTFDKEYRIICHDNQTERWVHGLGKLEFDAQGRILRMCGTIQDITERKRAEEKINLQLKELRQWYQTTLGREDLVR